MIEFLWILGSLIICGLSGYGIYWLLTTFWTGIITQNPWLVLGSGALAFLFGAVLIIVFIIGAVIFVAVLNGMGVFN